jgi:hypothetical protein
MHAKTKFYRQPTVRVALFFHFPSSVIKEERKNTILETRARCVRSRKMTTRRDATMDFKKT